MQTKIFAWTLITDDDHHGFLNDALVTLIDKTQASVLTMREYFRMTYSHICGCYYVGLLHDFERFFEALWFIT